MIKCIRVDLYKMKGGITMKYLAKKSVSLLLVLTLVFGTVSAGAVTSSAANAPSTSAKAAVTATVPSSQDIQIQNALHASPNPCIVVPGIGMSDVALFDANGNEIPNNGTFKESRWRVLNLVTSGLTKDIWKLIPQALLSIVFQKDVGLSDIIRNYMPAMFIYSAHDDRGNSIENVKAIERNYPLSQYSDADKADFFDMMPMQNYVNLIGENKIYCFNFPPFSNTFDQAARLDSFIQMVKQQTGCSKVNLVPLSLGATVTNAYFCNYADKHDVGKVVNVVGSSDGSLVFADLVGQNYSANSAKLFYSDIAPQLVSGYQGYLVNILLRILPKKVLDNVLDAAFQVVQKDFFTNIPSMWATVPSERYEQYANKFLSDPAHAYLRTLTDKYYDYQSHLQEHVKALVASGVQIYNICGYGFDFGHGWGDYQYFQFFKCADDINSDGIIQVSSTSMGATSANIGTTFPAGYVQQNDPAHNHISPDRTIDASTCCLPDQTWFFAGQHHEIANNDVAVALACTLLATDRITSIYSDPNFPQFNGSRYTKRIINDYIPAVTKALTRTDLTAADRTELQAALDQANAMLASMVADAAQCNAIDARLYNILVKIGVYTAPAAPSFWDTLLEKSLKFTSDKLWENYGPKGYSEIVGDKFAASGIGKAITGLFS